MINYAIQRLILAFFVAVAVSIIAFALLRLSGDLAMVLAGDGATDEEVRQMAERHGLDRPFVVQYFDWLIRMLQGDLGTSLFTHRPTMEMILEAVPVTAKIAFLSLGAALAFAIPLGVIAAAYPNTWIDRAVLALAVAGKAMPTFWMALVLMYWLGVQLRWLPISGSATWQHLVMPVIVLGTSVMPQLMRLTRSGMLDTLESDFIRMAWAKGLPAHVVFFKHALRNAILPLVSVAAVQLGTMLGGSVVIETIFAMQGIGYLAWESIIRSDPPVVQAIVLIIASFYVLLTFLADVLNAWLDPRLRAR